MISALDVMVESMTHKPGKYDNLPDTLFNIVKVYNRQCLSDSNGIMRFGTLTCRLGEHSRKPKRYGDKRILENKLKAKSSKSEWDVNLRELNARMPLRSLTIDKNGA